MRRSLAALLLTATLLAGCGAPQPDPEERARLEAPARSLEARGAWREAALAWQQAADAQGEGPLAGVFRLNAADALLEAGDGAGARAVVERLPESLPPPLPLRRALVLADAALLSGDATDALRRVGPAVTSTDHSLLARYRRIRSDALEITGDLAGAARERALRDALLLSAEQTYRNRQETWQLLERIPPDTLAAQPLRPPDAISGWFELAALARRNALDAEAMENAVREWSVRYPGHPAGEQIVPQVVERIRAEAQPPGKVALLLPQSGPFARPAAAVRDGFMAAWLADAPNPRRPELAFYDSASGDVALTYASAIADGAQFVVGPLAKESVNALLTDADLSVTTLMLNYPSPDADPVDGAAAHDAAAGTPDGSAAPPVDAAAAPDATAPPPVPAPMDLTRVHQFALAPEDEARQAADFAFARGARHAGVLAPEGDWGQRVSEAFAERWQALGGIVATTRFYPEEASDFSPAVAGLLNVDDSEQRARRLRAVLVRDIKHEPAPRSDLDVVFMAAFPQAARQLRPLLLFHRADALPVLSTSHAYAGAPEPSLDQDIDGLVFGDMPWVLSPDSHPLPARARQVWPAAAGAAGRLYAFGADAYALIAHLRDLRAGGAWSGLTGDLTLTGERRVQRALLWARVEQGVPATLDPLTAGGLLWGPPAP